MSSSVVDRANAIHLHVLNADGRLTGRQARIERAVRAAVRSVGAVLPVSRVDIVVCADPAAVLPEDGWGGHSPSGHLVQLFVDPDHPALDATLEHAVLTTLGHELHHCRRHRSVGYGTTLLEALVSEGLASRFEAELVPGHTPPYVVAPGEARLAAWIEEARGTWSAPSYDHDRWFFGAGTLPRHAGYAVGWRLVGEVMTGRGMTAAQLVDEPAATFAALAG